MDSAPNPVASKQDADTIITYIINVIYTNQCPQSTSHGSFPFFYFSASYTVLKNIAHQMNGQDWKTELKEHEVYMQWRQIDADIIAR